MQRICDDDDDDDDRRPNPTSHKERSIPFIRLLLKEHGFLILIQSNSEWKTLYPITEHLPRPISDLSNEALTKSEKALDKNELCAE